MPVKLEGTAAITGERVNIDEKYCVVTVQRGALLKNDNTWFKTSLLGLGPAAFDRTGNISLWMVCKLFELGRLSATYNPNYFSNQLLGSTRNMDVVMNYRLERSLYKRIYQRGINTSLDITHQLATFGKTSIDYAMTVVDPTDEQVLASLSVKCASVDMQKRTGAPIPDSIKEKYSKYCNRELMPKHFRMQPKPNNTPSMSYTVRSSDVDFILHMNNCVYFRLFSDAADEAVQRGLFKQFRDDILFYHPKTMQALYSRECRRGETLEVYTWEDVESTFILHCVIEKAGEPIFRTSIEFYPLEISKL